MPDVLPTNQGAVQQVTRKEYSPQTGEAVTKEYRGTSSEIEGKYTEEIAKKDRTAEFEDANGRARLVIRVVRTNLNPGFQAGQDNVEELYAVDVVQSVCNAQMFAALTGDQIVKTREAAEKFKATTEISDYASAWGTAQKQLYHMLQAGEETFYLTGFVLRRTVFTDILKIVQASFADVNRVITNSDGGKVDGVALSPQMAALVGTLPQGEWLKRPPQAEYLGKGKFRVCMEYQWAERWSILYGGSLHETVP